MTWNHRVFRRVYPGGPDETTIYFIGECYYDAHGSPEMWSEDPDGVQGENVEELKFTLESMLKALSRPVLDWDEGENEK